MLIVAEKPLSSSFNRYLMFKTKFRRQEINQFKVSENTNIKFKFKF